MDRDYELFVRIVHAGSLSAAGRGLNLSPAAVSKRLSRLEARIGGRLFQRTTRKLSLTDAGREFYDDVVDILSAAEAAEARLAGRTEKPSGRLRIAAPTSFGRLHVAPHLPRFMAKHPEVELELLLDDRFSDLLDERIDLAIRISTPPPVSLVAQRLAPNVRILCASPSYIAAHGTPLRLSDLRRHHLLAANHQSPWRLETRSGVRSLDVASRVVTNSSEVVRELALAGAGIALRSTWDVGDELDRGNLVRVLPRWGGSGDIAIHAVRPRAPQVPASVLAFTAFLAKLFGPTPYWDKSTADRSRA